MHSPTAHSPSGRDLELAAAIVVGLAVAWFIPPLAILTVWPWLTVVPGILLVTRAVPRLGAPGQIGVGAIAGVYGASHLVNVVSLVIGFGRPSVFVAAAALGALTIVLARWRLPFLADPPAFGLKAARLGLVADRAGWLVAAGVALAVLVVLGSSAWHLTADGWVSGGWNWSDFLVHVSIGESIVQGNFPPQVPYFVGAPLTYHWFADFHGAILATAAGTNVIPVFIVSSAAMAGVLALIVWELARSLTGVRRVATIATLLVCFGGGLGWIRLVLDVMNGAGDPWALLAQNPYDNTWAPDWPFFRIASVFGTGLLPHRATTFGLPGLIAVVLVLHASLRPRSTGAGVGAAVGSDAAIQTRADASASASVASAASAASAGESGASSADAHPRVGILLAGIIAALLAPFHFFAFPAAYLLAGLYVLASGTWRRRAAIGDAALFLAPIVLALPFVLDAILRQGDRGAFRFVLGWSEARIGDGPLAALFFYLTNLGLPFVLALVGAFARGLDLRIRVFLVAWLVALFVVPNVVVVSAVEFDMNKYFQMMWVAVAILAAWLIRRWSVPLIVAVVVFAAISPALVGIWHMRSTTVAVTVDQESAGRWIEQNTPERSVFVTDAYINSPVDLAGRLRLSGFGPYVANLGYDPDPRAQEIHSVYCDGDSAAAAIMARYAARYVLSSGGLLDCGGNSPTDFDSSPLFETVFRNGGVAVWELRP